LKNVLGNIFKDISHTVLVSCNSRILGFPGSINPKDDHIRSIKCIFY